MLVSEKRHKLLIDEYNNLRENRDAWKDNCMRAVNKCDDYEARIRELTGYITEKSRDIRELKAELERTDKVVVQYEKRINELEEE